MKFDLLLRQLIPKSPNYPADNGLQSKENLFFILYPSSIVLKALTKKTNLLSRRQQLNKYFHMFQFEVLGLNYNLACVMKMMFRG